MIVVLVDPVVVMVVLAFFGRVGCSVGTGPTAAAAVTS
jgi:hypothetical protein